jgi:RND family efflux transporter MFP subunit
MNAEIARLKLTSFAKACLDAFQRLSRRTRVVIASTLLLCLACIAAWASMTRGLSYDPSKECRIVKIGEAKSIVSNGENSYPGTVRAFTKVNLFFRVGGPVVEVDFQVGDKVKKGQVLMRIDPRDFERRVEALNHQVAQEEAKFAAMKSGDRPEDKEIALRDLAAATARFEKAKIDFDRADKLYEKDACSKAQYDEAKSSFLVAEADFASFKERLAKSNIGSRKEDIDAEKANLEAVKTQMKIAEDALSDTVLTAPFDGIITKRCLENHEMAQAFSPVIAMQDIDLVKIDVDVPETCLFSLDSLRGRKFSVSFNASPGAKYEAVLEEYDTDANAATRTYTLTMHMRQSGNLKVLPGMTAEVSGDFLQENADSARVVVPSSAVVRSPSLEKDLVWLVAPDGKSVIKREVNTAEASGVDGMIVAEGLKPGDRIVIAGGSFLEDGMIVRQLDFHKGLEVK